MSAIFVWWTNRQSKSIVNVVELSLDINVCVKNATNMGNGPQCSVARNKIATSLTLSKSKLQTVSNRKINAEHQESIPRQSKI